LRVKKTKNVAGMMGRLSPQGKTGISMAMDIDPMERMKQRFEGRSKGGKPRAMKRKTLMTGGY
jgi:hypothetical protein